jgi:hypothetical protein
LTKRQFRAQSRFVLLSGDFAVAYDEGKSPDISTPGAQQPVYVFDEYVTIRNAVHRSMNG